MVLLSCTLDHWILAHRRWLNICTSMNVNKSSLRPTPEEWIKTTKYDVPIPSKLAIVIYFCESAVLVLDTAQEVWWTHVEVLYFVVWFINPKDYNNQYYADKPFEECSKRQYYFMRNKEQYVHTLSHSRRSWIGLLGNPLDVHYPRSIYLEGAASRLN